MKKIIAIVTTILMCACLCTQVVAVELSAALSKISPELKEKFSKIGSSEKVTAYVAMQDVDHDAVMAEFAMRYPAEYNAYVAAKTGSGSSLGTVSENEALLQRALELKRAVYREFYLAQNQNVLVNYVDSRSQVFVSAYAPMAILELDRSSAIKMARSDDVCAVSEVSWSSRAIVDPLFPEDLTTFEIIGHLNRSNAITRADYLRDTKNLTGSGVKIGILEAGGVPDTTNPYLQDTSIVIRPGDEYTSLHATTNALILAAKSGAGTMYGVVPDAQFYCARWKEPNVSNADEHAKYFYEDAEWMISCGVNIINASFSLCLEDASADIGTYNVVSQWVDHIATVHDVHFVTSAGNNNAPTLTEFVTPPATAYNAIAVGGFWANNSENIVDFELTDRFSYDEKGIDRPEKPNLVANAYFGDYEDDGVMKPYDGTSFAAPQVTGVIAQLCCWDGNLKFRQNVVGAVLAASAAEKIDATVDNNQAYHFNSHIAGSAQISDREGAGILDARWAWGILANNNYWNIIQTGEGKDGTNVFYERTVTINTNVNNLTRIAIFWTQNSTNINHSNNTMSSIPIITNFNLRIFDSNGGEICWSRTQYSNFEIVQFVPTAPGIYTIRIEIVEPSNRTEYVGLAIW